MQDNRWVLIDLVGKGNRVRTVPVPAWVKPLVDEWIAAAGGDLEQIQFLLGHASILTTERYLGSRQNLRQAVNDNLGLEIEA